MSKSPSAQLAFAFDSLDEQDIHNNERGLPSPDPAICYELTRSKRKTLSIYVQQGKVDVRAPLRAPLYWIEAFVHEKRAWIQRQLQEQAAQLKQIIRIVDGEQLSILGQPLTIQIQTQVDSSTGARRRSRIFQHDNQLHIALARSHNQSEEQQATTLFFRWIKTIARDYMSPHTQELAKKINLHEKLRLVNYRRTRSKWGHCTCEGNIQYNPLIILAPQFVIDYIIAHEVCHLRYRNHSKSFWRLVEKSYPMWREAEAWLASDGHRLAIEVR